jgi:hypothetical protein
MFLIRKLKWVAVLMVILIMSTAAYTLAAANTVPASKAGDGSGAISGYTVSAIHYVLNAVPTTIDSVTFTLNSTPVAGSIAKIKLVAAGTTWYSCTIATANVTCTTTGASVSTADSLSVVVAD